MFDCVGGDLAGMSWRCSGGGGFFGCGVVEFSWMCCDGWLGGRLNCTCCCVVWKAVLLVEVA